MIGFDPTEDQQMMRAAVAQLAKATLRPRMREAEKARALAADVRKAAHEMGLGLSALPEAVGGSGLGMVTAVLLEEELAYGDPAAAFALGGPGALGLAVSELGTAEQARRALSPFAEDGAHARFGAVAWGEPRAHAERPGLVTTATRDGDGWRLDGQKAFVVNADRADAFVVFAQVDAAAGWRGTGAFLVAKESAGLAVLPRATTLGLDAASFGGLALERVRVTEEDRLAAPGYDRALFRFFAKNALLVAARAAGLSRAAFDLTRDYAEARKAFGKPIGHFQAVAFTLADRAMDAEAARSMVLRAARAWDALAEGTPGATENDALLRTAWAVSFALEAAMRAGDDAVQLHGGSGFMRDYPVEKLMRDAKQLQLCGMTAEHADQLAAAIELGLPLDPGALLPTAESQNAFV